MTTPVPHHPLTPWGYDGGFPEQFHALAVEGDQPVRVVRTARTEVVVTDGEGERRLALDPRLRGATVTTGDFAVMRGDLLVALLERRTAVVRSAATGDGTPQVLAANVDLVLVAEPLGERWRPRRIERLLLVAWQSGAVPVVVLTKADRAADPAAAVEEVTALAPGVTVLALSATEPESLAPLERELSPGRTAVIIGRSGAGKSTLANLLAGDEVLATGAVRSDGKGRHTTTSRELVRLASGGLLIDTPGVRSIGLVSDDGAIGDLFSDVEQLAADCRFSDCAHGVEPGCAVRGALEEGRLDSGRLAHYQLLQREQEFLAAREDARLRAERSRRWKTLSREARGRIRP